MLFFDMLFYHLGVFVALCTSTFLETKNTDNYMNVQSPALIGYRYTFMAIHDRIECPTWYRFWLDISNLKVPQTLVLITSSVITFSFIYEFF